MNDRPTPAKVFMSTAEFAALPWYGKVPVAAGIVAAVVGVANAALDLGLF